MSKNSKLYYSSLLIPFFSLPSFAMEAIENGSASLDFRYRYETVVQDNIGNTAHASTLRSRFNYTSAVQSDLQAQIEIDSVTVVGGDNHNDSHNGLTDHPIVADPEGTEINQAWLAYSGIGKTQIKYGRQRINHNNQRFIGGVGWRQNEQTYDGLTINNQWFENSKLSYGYINNINRIFGPDDGAQRADLDSKTHFINFNAKDTVLGNLAIYSYWLEFKQAQPLSNRTSGLRLSSKHIVDRRSYSVTAEYAQQSDYGDNPVQYDADYYALAAGFGSGNHAVKLGLEVLEGDANNAGQAFRTPLATLHKFNGWADKFLTTPGAGLEDIYIQVNSKLSDIALSAIYHQYDAENGSGDYGSEINLSMTKKLSENSKLLLKFADYNADGFAADTQKIWLQAQISF